MKLVQALALHLEIPRRQAAEMIDLGLVKVNGQVCLAYSAPFDLNKDRLEVSENKSNRPAKEVKKKTPISLESSYQKKYVALYKPRGVITSLDGKGNSLNDIVRQIGFPNLKPVGRLDAESEGLLLLTDDGQFINHLTHPRHGVSKIYKVWASGYKETKQLEFLEKLLTVVKFKEQKPGITLEIRLQEGQNRQIRRACAQAGLFVERILRIAIGAVELGKLNPGEWKILDPVEIKGLYRTE